jgi:hypothetical protein
MKQNTYRVLLNKEPEGGIPSLSQRCQDALPMVKQLKKPL